MKSHRKIAIPKLTNIHKNDGLETHHHITDEREVSTKKEMAKDLCLIFTDIISVQFIQKDGSSSLVKGCWCRPCRLALHKLGRKEDSSPDSQRDNAVFIAKEGKQKAFHTGGNSSCHAHIRQHFKLYQERCKEANIPEHHWAIPHPIWNKMEAEQQGIKSSTQGTLDSMVKKPTGPQVFTHENVLHMVTQFIAIDDQVSLAVASREVVHLMRLCLPVALHGKQNHVPKLPSGHEAKILIAQFANYSQCGESF